jgi:WD40 repeat protein/serine/threonine protein kinase
MNDSPALDEQLLQRLPLPLAQLCRRAHNAKTSLESHLTAYYLWEAALKLLSAAAVVEYADLREHDPELSKKLRGLARPSVGHWWEFVRRLVPVLADRGDKGFAAVRDLLLGDRARDDFARAAALHAALGDARPGKAGARATVRLNELFDRLVRYRNREIGHGAAGQQRGDYYEGMAATLLAGVTQLLGRVDVVAGRRLVHVADVRRLASGGFLIERYLLVSEAPRRLEPLQLPEAEMSRLPRPDRVYLEGRRDPRVSVPFPTLRSLYPLVQFDLDSSSLFFLNGCRGPKKVEYLCYSSGAVRQHDPAGKDQRELLARVLGQPVDAGSVESWAADSPGDELPVAPAGAQAMGEFELLSQLGKGGMGVVYRAWQPSLGREVALKCMLRSNDPKAEERFAREIRALGRVEHPNVVKVFTSGAEGTQWFYAMELIEGAELSRVCAQLAGSSATEIDAGRWQQALTCACEEARSQETPLGAGAAPSTRGGSGRTAPEVEPPAAPARPAGGHGHVRQVVEIVRQVAAAAHALHEAGVVHRDIKPGNIMLTADGAHPVLMDLGLAQLADETDAKLTRTRQFVGTLRYASPEQVLAAGPVDRRTDVYSLGVSLWELLTLRPAHGADDNMAPPDLMTRIQTTDLERPRRYNPHVPRDLEAIVMKCAEKDRSRRYATASDLADDLGRFLNEEPVMAQPPSLRYLAGKYMRRHRVALRVAAAVAVLLFGGAVAAFVGIDLARREAIYATKKLQEAVEEKDEQLYVSNIAVAERELTSSGGDVTLASRLLERCPEQLRGWEWDYLMRLRDGGRAPLAGAENGGHDGGLWTAVWSPDGRRIATASIDGTAKVWDAASGKVLGNFQGHRVERNLPGMGLLENLPGWDVIDKIPRPDIAQLPRVPVACLAFSPDGRHIASGSLAPNAIRLADPRAASGVVKVWEAESGRVVQTFNDQVGLVMSLAYSHDGERVASASINDDFSFVVWDVRNAQVLHRFHDHASNVHRLCFSPNDRVLISGSTDGCVKVWDAVTFERLHNIENAHPAPVYNLTFSPDGSRFASAGFDGTVRVWRTETGEPAMEPLRGHTGATMGVAYSPDGKRIASAGYDKTVRLWDAATGKERITLRGHTEYVCSVAFSPDGKQLLSASFDKSARVWDAARAVRPSGPGLFMLGGHEDRVNAVAFSPDGRVLASGGWDAAVRLWDGSTGAELRTLKGHKGSIWRLAFSRDGTRLASASWDRTVKVWDVASGRELRTLAGHMTPVHGVAFSPDGHRLVSSSWEGLVKFWDADTGIEQATLKGHLFPTMAVAFSPDGQRIASASGDRTVKLWDVESGRELRTLTDHTALVHGVAFSRDGKLLATASWDYTAKLWDASSGEPLKTLKGHTDRVQGVAFSPDGRRVATASEDKTVRVWDVATGQEVVPARRHRGPVWSVDFSADGKRVVAGCWAPGAWVQTWDAEKP